MLRDRWQGRVDRGLVAFLHIIQAMQGLGPPVLCQMPAYGCEALGRGQ